MSFSVLKSTVAGVFVWAAFAFSPVAAQAPSPTDTPAVAIAQTTVTSNTQVITATQVATPEATSAGTVGTAPDLPVLPTPTPEAGSDPLEGTIVANRGQNTVRFFVEGGLYELPPGRSQSIQLTRPTTVLNLYNCPANTPESNSGCFWDPYLVQQNGFYEFYSASETSIPAKILLREAAAPPENQVWVQNRTGQIESVVFHSDVFEMSPTSVLEFPVAAGVPAILYVRNCLALEGQQVCEWAPRTLEAGVYYALVEVTTPSSEPGAVVITVDLRPVVAGEGIALDNAPDTATAGSVSAAARQDGILCRLEVPALNIRSGPGLQYDIIGKIRTTGDEAATVVVTGRSADGQWLIIDRSVADNGWITASASFITCERAASELLLVEVEAPIPAATPEPPASAVSLGTPEPTAEPTVEVVEAPAPEAVSQQVPEGYAQLLVNNGFQHEMRFTIDQVFRPFDGPSEYDIQPGDSVSVIVFPGQIAFTASSGWHGLSQNADLTIDPDQTVHLWLRFELDAGNSWVLLWE